MNIIWSFVQDISPSDTTVALDTSEGKEKILLHDKKKVSDVFFSDFEALLVKIGSDEVMKVEIFIPLILTYPSFQNRSSQDLDNPEKDYLYMEKMF